MWGGKEDASGKEQTRWKEPSGDLPQTVFHVERHTHETWGAGGTIKAVRGKGQVALLREW